MKYGFIGCGNMGSAIARALSRVTTDFLITDRSGKAKALAQELGCTYTDSAEICRQADAIFLGVKPHMLKDTLAPLVSALQTRRPLLISMAAGIQIRQIEEFLGEKLPILRIMPNTPVAVGRGMIQYCRNDLVTEEMLQAFLRDLSGCGVLDPLDESLIDAASAISGCGPAFVYQFIEALADGAVACGIPRAKAIAYAAATVIGAGEMVRTTGQHPGALKDAVCSPGGSTIQGVRTLEQHGFRGAVMDCIIAAYEKNQKLGR